MGNYDKGWNDPPMVSKPPSTTVQQTKRTILNKRVAFPVNSANTMPIFNPACPPSTNQMQYNSNAFQLPPSNPTEYNSNAFQMPPATNINLPPN